MNPSNKIKKGKLAVAKGFANESRFLAALLARGFNGSKVDLPHSTYDIIVELSKDNMIRVQVKTVSQTGSLSFRGGVRGGQDRKYQSSVKEYTQSVKTSDIVVGVESSCKNGDSDINFYFLPTLFIESIKQSSLSIRKIPQAKNNWKIFRFCKDKEFVKDNFPGFNL